LSTAVELGCGISGIVGLLLAPRISRYILTDQSYVAKLVEQNLEENRLAVKNTAKTTIGRRSRTATSETSPGGNISFASLDWETDVAGSALRTATSLSSFDLVIACDCIYNEALIEPLVQTCVDICKLRDDDDSEPRRDPTVCIVAQQLRDPDIFGAWLVRFSHSFDVWRIPDSSLSETLRPQAGFVVHVGILKRSS
jgi:hypothetical protein